MNKLVAYFPDEIFLNDIYETYVLRIIQWKTSLHLLITITFLDIMTDTEANYTVSFSPDIAFFKSNIEEVVVKGLNAPIKLYL